MHQAIGDLLPQRLDFYEEWLDPDRLRDGSVGLAPITAVLGFLRTEGLAYEPIMVRAGQLAAEWTCASMPGMRRRLTLRLPRGLRARAALGVARRIVRDVLTTSDVSTRVRKGQARFDVRASLFCTVRDPQPGPLCGFYRAVAIGTFREFGLAADGAIDQCRASGAESCVITLHIDGEAAAQRIAA